MQDILGHALQKQVHPLKLQGLSDTKAPAAWEAAALGTIICWPSNKMQMSLYRKLLRRHKLYPLVTRRWPLGRVHVCRVSWWRWEWRYLGKVGDRPEANVYRLYFRYPRLCMGARQKFRVVATCFCLIWSHERNLYSIYPTCYQNQGSLVMNHDALLSWVDDRDELISWPWRKPAPHWLHILLAKNRFNYIVIYVISFFVCTHLCRHIYSIHAYYSESIDSM